MNEIRTIEPFIRLGERLAEELLDGTIEPVIRRSEPKTRGFPAPTSSRPYKPYAPICSTAEIFAHGSPDTRPPAGRPTKRSASSWPEISLWVGFFDLLCVLICDRRRLIKPSSKDRVLIGHIVDLLREIEPRFSIGALEGQTPDRLIASGSDEARRHFASAYPDTPSLLRGHRYSVAVLSGQESDRAVGRAVRRRLFWTSHSDAAT